MQEKGCSCVTAFWYSEPFLVAFNSKYGCLISKPKFQEVSSVFYKVSWPIHNLGPFLDDLARDDQCSACLLLLETAIKVLGCIRNAQLLTCIILKRPIFQASCSMQK